MDPWDNSKSDGHFAGAWTCGTKWQAQKEQSGSTTGCERDLTCSRLWDKEGYVAEKAEGDTGWLFPVGDEVAELGYSDMFVDMFNAWDEGREPMETLYDGYVVNAIIDACYKSAKTKQWEPIEMEWRGSEVDRETALTETDAPVCHPENRAHARWTPEANCKRQRNG